MPKDANAAMQLASRVNGLGSLDKPWHLKADYQTFDADGKPKDKGVFEEWWAGPEKYKVSYTSNSFTQTLYWNDGKGWITGDPGWPPTPQEMVRQYLVHPLPDAAEVAKQKYFAVDQKAGQLPLKCLKQGIAPQFVGDEAPHESAGPWTPSICLMPESPIMRVENPDMTLFVLFNDILRLDGRYVAGQVAVEDAKASIVNANVTELQELSKIDDVMFAPPTSALPAPVEGGEKGLIAGHKISGPDPEFSPSKRVEGTVILEMVITKTGEVSDLRVISGPKGMRQTALDTVRKWKFQPYLLNGQPVDAKASAYITNDTF